MPAESERAKLSREKKKGDGRTGVDEKNFRGSNPEGGRKADSDSKDKSSGGLGYFST